MSGKEANSGSIVAVQKDRGQKRPRCTSEQFIEKARLVHGDTYDYSKVVYVKAIEKVIITCKDHGAFEQTPNGHLSGAGCRVCATIRNAEKAIRACSEKFVAAAQKVHGDKYDYSESVYISARINTVIICKLHGKFEQTPNSHLNGSGCVKCGRNMTIFSTEQFIEEATKVHDVTYDYSKSIYSKMCEKLTIRCKIHGDFQQSPSNHLNGQGCYKCGHNMTIFTTEQFKEEAKKVHGLKYCYSKSVYSKMHEKVTIQCETHGDFEQTPSSHITKKAGCQKCTGTFVSNTGEFIDKVKNIHGDKYHYGNVVYINNHTKVFISCSEHGDFEQTPHNHLAGIGCPRCGRTATTEKQRKPLQDFVDESNVVHSFKYSYDKVDYVNARTEVTIVCPFHGEFQQTPDVHLRGCGCYKCGYNMTIFNTEQFIEEAKKVHGFKYGYSKSVYSKMHEKVTIQCETHGDFEQTPSNHITRKSGCQQCAGTFVSNTVEFIDKAKKIHGEKYLYGKVVYIKNHTKVLISCPEHGDFEQPPSSHLAGHGCFKCSSGYSKGQIQWLDFLSSYHSIHIQHAANDGEFLIPDTRYRADGYCAETTTVYEYHGDYWHGNPKKFNQHDMNKSSKKTFGELYEQTMKRENEIRALGYNLVVMWESDWLRLNRCVRKVQQKIKANSVVKL